MLKSIGAYFSETGKLELEARGITIFVGPNNSGKSLVLKEIESLFFQDPMPESNKIVKDFGIVWPTELDIDKAIDKARGSSPTINNVQINFARINVNGGRESLNVDESTLRHYCSNKVHSGWITTQFLRWGVIRLDGRSRFNLTGDQAGGDLQAPPQNVLSHLFQDDDARREVRRLISEAFNVNFYVDPTNLGQLRIKLASGKLFADEQSLGAETRKFFGEATHIKDASDGVQAFTGIVTAVLSGEYHTILIDEPEAFLHPPLARKLGKNLADIVTKRDATLMASTHSSDFLMGCVQASPLVRVVRLEYSQGKSRARSIDPAVLEKFLKRPLMRSANVISGLFHDGVVVVESDNDRAFYSEIYHRLSEGRAGYPAILFVNAQNKQTIREIIGPLRQFGVPAAAIPDVDIVKDGGKTWINWLVAAQIPEMMHASMGQQRAAIYEALKASGWNMKSDGGLELLNGGEHVAANMLFDSLEAFGVFPVRIGEVENWLSALSVPGKKTDWAVAMLERLGADASAEDYVRPSDGDVWAFLERVVRWIMDPGRQGTA